MVGYYDQVKRSWRNGALAPGTEIRLAGCIGLNWRNGDLVHRQAKIAHTTTAVVTSRATTTIKTSNVVFSCCRNGLSPMEQP